jgi:hypothetical protein
MMLLMMMFGLTAADLAKKQVPASERPSVQRFIASMETGSDLQASDFAKPLGPKAVSTLREYLSGCKATKIWRTLQREAAVDWYCPARVGQQKFVTILTIDKAKMIQLVSIH